MKSVLMLGAALLAVVLGFMPSIRVRKPLWWRALVIVCVSLTIVLALLPPIGGSMADVVIATRADSTKIVPYYCIVTSRSTGEDRGALFEPPAQIPVTLTDVRNPNLKVSGWYSQRELIGTIPYKTPVVLNVRRARSDTLFSVASAPVAVDPWITLPYIMGLEERARIIFFHVPMAWVAFIAYLIAMVFGIKYLKNRDLADDAMSASAASVGTLFTILATLTGAVWAKFNWGEYWNWDPRQTTIFLLLLVYAAYFVLRASINDDQVRARLSSVYSIIAFVTVPFLIFILPRLAPGLHPGSADDTNIGPLLSTTSDAINLTKQLVFLLALFSFTLVYFWLMNIRYRALAVERAIARDKK